MACGPLLACETLSSDLQTPSMVYINERMGHPESLVFSSSSNSERRIASSKIDKNIEKNYFDNENVVGTFDFQTKELTVFPLFDLGSNGVHITHINIDYNKISQLPEKIHELLPALQVFAANSNELSILPDGFGEFSHLQELYLCDNNLISLPESLSKLTKLRVLKLDANCLMRLHAEIGQNTFLEVLCVNENRLRRFPATLGLLKNLSVLEASFNVLELLPSTLNFLENLKFVDLRNNILTHIPESFGKLKNLTHIDLSENRISNLCESFQSTRTLQRLYLDHNSFTRCPEWFKDLDNITEIRMKCNKLSGLALPEGFGLRSQRFNILDLRGNSIQKLPISFGHLIFLESLLLGISIDCLEKGTHFQNGNWLSSLPSNFAELIFLRQLHLEDCQLRNLPDDIGKLVHLEDIFLGSNMLCELPQSFTQLVALKKCQLSKNRLINLPDDIGSLKVLTELCLDFNKLKCLPASMKNLTNLELLDLSNNKLKQWSPDLICAMTRLKSLNLCNNRFIVPDCDIPNVIKKMHIAEKNDGCNTINWQKRQNRLKALRQSSGLSTSQCLKEADASKDEDIGSSIGNNSSWDLDDDDDDEWNEETDKHSLSSSSASEEISNCQQDLVESWDVDSEHESSRFDPGSGQFDDDYDEPTGQMFATALAPSILDSYGNCSNAIYLDIHKHLSAAPYLYHVPSFRSIHYVQPTCEVPGQFDCDIVSESAGNKDIIGKSAGGNDIIDESAGDKDIVIGESAGGKDIVIGESTDGKDNVIGESTDGKDIVIGALNGIIIAKASTDSITNQDQVITLSEKIICCEW